MLELNTQVTVYYAQDKRFHAAPAKVIGRSFSAHPTYDVLLEHGAVLCNITPDNLELREGGEKICETCHGNHYVTLGDGKTKMCETCYVD